MLTTSLSPFKCLCEAIDKVILVSLETDPVRAGKEMVHHFYERSHPLSKIGGIYVVLQKKQGGTFSDEEIEEIW